MGYSLIEIAIYTTLCLLVGLFGLTRQSGLFFTFIFSIAFTPIVGGIIAAFSGGKNEPLPKPQLYKKIIGVLFMLISPIIAIGVGESQDIYGNSNPKEEMNGMFLAAGFFFFGMYYLYRGSGQRGF